MKDREERSERRMHECRQVYSTRRRAPRGGLAGLKMPLCAGALWDRSLVSRRAEANAAMRSYGSAQRMRAIDRDNALRLLPGSRTRAGRDDRTGRYSKPGRAAKRR